EDGDAAFARLQLARHQLHERRFAGAVRTQQSRDARRNGQRDVIQSDHLSVPLREVIRGDDRRAAHATISTPRMRRSRMTADTPMSASTTPSEMNQGVS